MRFLGSRPKLLALPILVSLFAIGCWRKSGPQNVIRMADLHTQKQLIRGFYSLEDGAWRWTSGDFLVSLKVPEEVQQKGGTLTLQGSLTPTALQNGPLEISSSLSGVPLAKQSFSKPGEFVYRVDVPVPAAQRPVALAEFTVSRTHRVPGDQRELGVIASVISLRSK